MPKNNIEIELRGPLPKNSDALRKISYDLRRHFGPPYFTEELDIFFKYDKDVRMRLTKEGLELRLKLRPDQHKKRYMLEEYITKIPMDYAIDFINTLYEIGYQEGLFSYFHKYLYQRGGYTFCIKLNTVCGDFFEIDKNIADPKKANQTKKELASILSQLNLKAWTGKEYDAHRKKCWAGIKKEKLIINKKRELHPKIKRIILKYKGKMKKHR